jgi:hypothetical protein
MNEINKYMKILQILGKPTRWRNGVHDPIVNKERGGGFFSVMVFAFPILITN